MSTAYVQRYMAIANTNEFGLVSGKQYLVENPSIGMADVYDMDGNYLKSCRIDSFDHWTQI